MRAACIIVAVLVSLSRGAVLPETKDINKRETHEKDVQTDLSKIKALLQELQNEEVEETSAHKKETTTQPPPRLRELKEPMKEVGVWHQVVSIPKSDVISPRDLETLKELKRILEKVRRQKGTKAPQPITADSSEDSSEDMDDLAVSKDDVSESSWRDLARHLESERDQLYLQKQQKDNKPIKVKAVITEGEFVPFKDEVKASVEKNLMTDLALAIHSGITIDEIIQDLTDRAHSRD